MSLEQHTGALCGHVFRGAAPALPWDPGLAACPLACSAFVTWPVLPEPGLLPEWKAVWQARVLGSAWVVVVGAVM